jgi:cytochrome c biogenesis protein ResB
MSKLWNRIAESQVEICKVLACFIVAWVGFECLYVAWLFLKLLVLLVVKLVTDTKWVV